MRWQLDAHDVAPATCTLQVDCAWLFASSIFPFPLSLSGCTTLSAVVLQVGFTTLAVELGVYVRGTRKAPLVNQTMVMLRHRCQLPGIKPMRQGNLGLTTQRAAGFAAPCIVAMYRSLFQLRLDNQTRNAFALPV